MQAHVLTAGPPRIFAVIFDPGDEVIDGLERFARETGADAAGFTAIGAFADVTLGYFDLDSETYRRNPVAEQVEVVSLVGDITRCDRSESDDARARAIHAHVVVARSDGIAMGGHLLDGHVRPTLEVIVSESPAHLRRRYDAGTGLALIDLEASRS